MVLPTWRRGGRRSPLAKVAPKPGPKAAAPAPPPAPAPAVVPVPPAEPAKGTNTGLPLPRFASLKTDEVNLRTGPGTRYPIDWVYKRRDLPVQIEREFEVWRLIADSEGVKGWVHQATLTGRRSFVLTSGEHVMRADGSDTAAAPRTPTPPRPLTSRSSWCRSAIRTFRPTSLARTG